MFDALIDRENGEISRPCKSSMSKEATEALHNADGAVAGGDYALYPVRAREHQMLLRNIQASMP